MVVRRLLLDGGYLGASFQILGFLNKELDDSHGEGCESIHLLQDENRLVNRFTAGGIG